MKILTFCTLLALTVAVNAQPVPKFFDSSAVVLGRSTNDAILPQWWQRKNNGNAMIDGLNRSVTSPLTVPIRTTNSVLVNSTVGQLPPTTNYDTFHLVITNNIGTNLCSGTYSNTSSHAYEYVLNDVGVGIDFWTALHGSQVMLYGWGILTPLATCPTNQFPGGLGGYFAISNIVINSTALTVQGDASVSGNVSVNGTNITSALTNLIAQIPQAYGVDSRVINASFAPPSWTPTSTRYVSKTGQDGTGGHDGTTLANAWLTLAYAATTAAEGALIMIDDGTYTEGTSGQAWKPVLTYTTAKEFRAINAGQVVVQGNGDANFNLLQQNTWSNVRFTGLVFTNNGASLYVVDFYNNNTTNVIFQNCTFHGNTSAHWIVNFETSAASISVAVDFYNCTFWADSTAANGALNLTGVSATNTTHIIRNYNPTVITQSPDGVRIYCPNTYTPKAMCYYQIGGSIVANGAAGHGVQIGMDGPTGSAVTGVILNTSINAPGHGILFGAGSTGCYARNVSVTNSNDNIVFKNSTNSTVEFCTLWNPSLVGVLFKGGNGCVAKNNLILLNGGGGVYGLSNDDGASGTYKSQACAAFNNWVVVNNATSLALHWTTSGDSAATAFGRNYYQIISGTLGSVNGINCLTQGDLLSAWNFTNEVTSLVQ